jgi:hypothetical protein
MFRPSRLRARSASVHTVLVVSDDLAVCNAVRYSVGIDPQFVVCAESENDIDALAKGFLRKAHTAC